MIRSLPTTDSRQADKESVRLRKVATCVDRNALSLAGGSDAVAAGEGAAKTLAGPETRPLPLHGRVIRPQKHLIGRNPKGLVDLSEPRRVSGRGVYRARCLTAHGSLLRSCISIKSTSRKVIRQVQAAKIWLLAMVFVVGFFLFDCTPVFAHDQIPGKPQTRPIVIKNATIHPVDRPTIEEGWLLLEDGLITGIGKAVAVPESAIEIDGSGKHIYPGLIASISDIGLNEISSVTETDDRVELGDRNPNVRSWVAVNPDSELIPVARAGGVLTAMTAPLGPWMRGQSAVLNLDGWTVAEMTLLAPAGLVVNWSAMRPRQDKDDDGTKREQQLADLDALLDEARRYRAARAARPETTPSDLRLECLLPVIDGSRPWIAEANLQDEIESAVAYAQSQSLRLVIHGGYDAESCSELLTKYNIPVIIGSTLRLPIRRDDPYDAAFTLPQRLHQAGILFSIAGEGRGASGGASNLRNLPQHAAVAVGYGLSRELALRSITLSAAEIIGVADRVGSITVGKDATLIITDGDILEIQTNVTDAFIQGRKVDLGSRHKTLYEKYKQKYSKQ